MAGANGVLRAAMAPPMNPATPAPQPDEVRSRSLLRPAILLLLRDQEDHGYELMGRLAELGAEVPPTTGALYRSLRAMADGGFLRSYWHTSERGPARRVYAITPLGEQHLEQLISGLSGLLDTVQHMLDRYGHPAGPSPPPEETVSADPSPAVTIRRRDEAPDGDHSTEERKRFRSTAAPSGGACT